MGGVLRFLKEVAAVSVWLILLLASLFVAMLIMEAAWRYLDKLLAMLIDVIVAAVYLVCMERIIK